MSHHGHIMLSSVSLSSRSWRSPIITLRTKQTLGNNLVQFLGHRTWKSCQFTSHSMEILEIVLWSSWAINSPLVNDDFVKVLSKGKGCMSWHLVTSPFLDAWDCLYWVEVVGTEIHISFGVICFVYLSRSMKQIVRTDFLIFLFVMF